MAKKWRMQKWMEAHRDMIVNTGGNSIEQLMNGSTSPLINLPLSTLEACVKSQVELLTIMHNKGII